MMDSSQPQGVEPSTMLAETAPASPSSALRHNNVKVLEMCLSRQLSHRSLACVLTLHRRFAQLADYVRKHRLLFALQVLGTTTLIAALIMVPVLGAMGFSTLGPVAGSTAAAWQASIGLVEAGSLFAFCQSAAMRGAAFGTVVTAGALGGVAAVAPVIHKARARMADFGNMVKRKWCGLWN